MLLTTILLTALVANGLWMASEKGQVLYPLQQVQLPKWIAKPLIMCITCMAGSLWNIITVLLYYVVVGYPAIEIIVAHIVLNGLGAAYLATLLKRVANYFDEDKIVIYRSFDNDECIENCREDD